MRKRPIADEPPWSQAAPPALSDVAVPADAAPPTVPVPDAPPAAAASLLQPTQQQPLPSSPSAFPSSSTDAMVTDQQRRLAAESSRSGVSLDKLGYSWDQNEGFVRIYLKLSHASTEDLHCECSKRGVQLTAEVGTPPRRYFFDVSNLWGAIDPEQSAARVPKSKAHVTLRLRKAQPGVEWPLLRSLDDEIFANIQ